ncbi:hypothetical protein DAPPUDRAFT_244702 [Daphnia pulex]|uniref:Uncharacterized protein n=1 Tax=Daphnia pulex TaxID=6669 RepID=E9GLK7_DAPPU|nr:hypothetical protein DAPPUDRAFT_244702 [Daphnia pulex]|eukprot:EFX79528.1 hypothetical protein DAPPUDRAFT_244702 [Daphnia pulex]
MAQRWLSGSYQGMRRVVEATGGRNAVEAAIEPADYEAHICDGNPSLLIMDSIGETEH